MATLCTHVFNNPPPSHPPFSRRRRCGRTLPVAGASRLQSFLDLAPEHKPEPLRIDLPWHDPSSSPRRRDYDAAVIGCGPAGLRVADRAAALGLRVCVIDPDPLSSWPNNYGCWVDELAGIGLDGCLDKTWPAASVFVDDRRTKKILHRPYGRICRKALKTLLLESCAAAGVRFCRAMAWGVEHDGHRSRVSTSDGGEVAAAAVIDAGGFSSRFVEFAAGEKRDHGFQIAHGILAEVDSHPFATDEMLLMDWRDGHLGNEPRLRTNNAKVPTFLYAMPFDPTFVFLEETSLVSRPVLPYSEVKQRMVARLRHLGIRVRRVIEEEKCLIPMGGPLPAIPQGTVGFGGAAAMPHPATGYMVARSLALASELAAAMAECLSSSRLVRGVPMQRQMWEAVWPESRRREREFYRFGMETLLRLDLEGTRGFLDAFFDLEPRQWQGFLSSKLTVGELVELGVSLFGKGSGRCRVDLATKTPAPMARMVRNLAFDAVGR